MFCYYSIIFYYSCYWGSILLMGLYNTNILPSALLHHFSILCPIGTLKLTMVGVLMPQTLENAINQQHFPHWGLLMNTSTFPASIPSPTSHFITETYREATEIVFLTPFWEPPSLCPKVSLLPLMSSSAASLPTSPKTESHLSLGDW